MTPPDRSSAHQDGSDPGEPGSLRVSPGSDPGEPGSLRIVKNSDPGEPGSLLTSTTVVAFGLGALLGAALTLLWCRSDES